MTNNVSPADSRNATVSQDTPTAIALSAADIDSPSLTFAVVAGLLAGLVVVRQPPLFLAVSTWILSWLVLLVAVEFPEVAGGSQGYVVTSSLSASGHYELALLLTVAAVAGLSALRREARDAPRLP